MCKDEAGYLCTAPKWSWNRKQTNLDNFILYISVYLHMSGLYVRMIAGMRGQFAICGRFLIWEVAANEAQI